MARSSSIAKLEANLERWKAPIRGRGSKNSVAIRSEARRSKPKIQSRKKAKSRKKNKVNSQIKRNATVYHGTD